MDGYETALQVSDKEKAVMTRCSRGERWDFSDIFLKLWLTSIARL